MIVFRRRGIQFAEIWYDEPIPTEGADVVIFVQRSAPVPGSFYREKHTLLWDISKDEETLFSSVRRTNRRSIQRAHDLDGISCRVVPPNETNLSELCTFYKRFASDKGLDPASLSYLTAIARSGRLELSQAFDSQTGEVLVWHSYLMTPTRARGLYSASLFRESEDVQRRHLIGRANRYLHWTDVLRFKEAHIDAYDWGGWYAGTEDEAKLRINQFKVEFGGEIVKEWSGEIGLTWKGKLALGIRRLLSRSA